MMKKYRIKTFIICLGLLLTGSTLNAVTIISKSLHNIHNQYESDVITFDKSSDRFVLADQYIKLNFQLGTDMLEWKIEISGVLKNIKPEYKDKDFQIPLACKLYTSVPSDPKSDDPNDTNSGWHWMNSGDTLLSGTINYAMMPDGTTCNSRVYICIEGDFKNAVEGEYAGDISFKITDLTDKENPVVIHIPIAKIGMVGNNIKIEAEITDDRKIVSVDLHYRIDDGAWKEKAMEITDKSESSQIKYHASAVINAKEILGSSKIYYYIETSDGFNSEFWKSKEAPQVIEISQATEFTEVKEGILEVEDGNPEDGTTSLNIEKGALDHKVSITIRQRNLDDPDVPDGSGAAASARPVAVFELKPDGLRFNKPVNLTMLYLDLDHDGKIENYDGTLTGIEETRLGLFWWDGFDWRLIGRNSDEDMNTVSGKITHFTLFAIFPVGPLSADDYRPKRNIITPEASVGINDEATFDALTDEYEINIYDISGRLVKTIDENDDSGPEWDGTDEYGNIVESGVYIYQFKAEIDGKMKLISGTIVVAK